MDEFNLNPSAPVAGIVARVQRHRRFDLLLQAIRLVAAAIPDFKFLIMGRGTHIDELARRPVADLGLEDTVVFSGYRDEDYADVLNLLDSNDHDVDYFYASRLSGEPPGGVEDIHYHVFEPRQVRAYVSFSF